jgi:AraC-like DNA-binding protein
VVAADLPVTGHFLDADAHRPALGVGVALRPAAIAPLLLETPPGRWSRAGAAPPALASGPAGPDLLDAVARLLRLLDHPTDAPVLAPLVEREILWRLLTGPHGAVVRQIGLADSGLAHVGRAIRWLRANYAEPVRVEDLARLAGMSSSAFHRHFRAVTAMSPLQFQKRIRLQEARTLLVARPDDVAGVGHLVGDDSPSQFNREYRRLFGAPPGQDAARLRSTSPAGAWSSGL